MCVVHGPLNEAVTGLVVDLCRSVCDCLECVARFSHVLPRWDPTQVQRTRNTHTLLIYHLEVSDVAFDHL